MAQGGLNVTLVVANTFQFDSRLLRTARTLADDGHAVRDPRLGGLGAAAGGGAVGRRPDQPHPPRPPHLDGPAAAADAAAARASVALLGLDPEQTVLSPEAPRGADRLRHPIRRLLEIVANARRVGPWSDAVVAAAPETDVFHAKALIVLPVVRAAARSAWRPVRV